MLTLLSSLIRWGRAPFAVAGLLLLAGCDFNFWRMDGHQSTMQTAGPVAMSERHAVAFRVGTDALAEFPVRIDVRSPAEFAIDRVPEAINLPVLDNAERARIGTLYMASPFAARKTERASAICCA